ncbi:MAG: MaoC family dehydratase [Pseudomonadota bacterium]
MLFFEDIAVGHKARFGRYAVTREEVLDFASKYDPQPFHLDDEAAAKTFFGKVSASGWHTCAMTMRMMVEQMQDKKIQTTGSPGVDKIRWRTPVYPGDVLSVRSEVLGKKDLPSKPDMGIITAAYEVLNQDGVVVMTFEGAGLYHRRPI